MFELIPFSLGARLERTNLYARLVSRNARAQTRNPRGLTSGCFDFPVALNRLSACSKSREKD